MPDSVLTSDLVRVPAVRDMLELTKPVTWFPPMWAFLCGVVSSGISLADHWAFLLAGIALTGPIVCGTSQVINDWCDRHVDSINEPNRPIPSGRVPGRWPVWIALFGSGLSLALGAALVGWVLAATCVALFCGWAYSSPPFRFKKSGWLGPLVCALSYEGLSWFTGASVMVGGLPSPAVIAILLLYSLGAHGIMTLNDFKAVEGDAQMGVRSLPVQMGVTKAAWTACAFMLGSQWVVVALLMQWGSSNAAFAVLMLSFAQLPLMLKFVQQPIERALSVSAFGVPLFVSGMMVSAWSLRGVEVVAL